MADLQKRHLVNKTRNQKLIAEAEQISSRSSSDTNNKVTVYLPNVTGADSPSTIQSDSSPAAVVGGVGGRGEKETAKVRKIIQDNLVHIDESLPLSTTGAETSKIGLTHDNNKPDSDLDVSVMNSDSVILGSSNVNSTAESKRTVEEDISLSFSRIESGTTTLSLQQYPLTGSTTSPPLSSGSGSALSLSNHNKHKNNDKKSPALKTEMSPTPAIQRLVGEAVGGIVESATTQASSLHQKSESLTQQHLDHQQQQQKQQKQSKPIDMDKLQRKREELRNQYPNLFKKTTTISQSQPKTTKGSIAYSPSVEILDRLKNHRESLKQQRQLLEQRRHERQMESVEDTLRRSASLGMHSPIDANPAPIVSMTDRASSPADDIDFKINRNDPGLSQRKNISPHPPSSMVQQQNPAASTKTTTQKATAVVSFQEPAMVFLDGGSRRERMVPIASQTLPGNAVSSSVLQEQSQYIYELNRPKSNETEVIASDRQAHIEPNLTQQQQQQQQQQLEKSPERPDINRKVKNRLCLPGAKDPIISAGQPPQTTFPQTTPPTRETKEQRTSPKNRNNIPPISRVLPTVNAMLSELRDLQSQIEEHHQIDGTIYQQQQHQQQQQQQQRKHIYQSARDASIRYRYIFLLCFYRFKNSVHVFHNVNVKNLVRN